jgi:hypothetical protein
MPPALLTSTAVDAGKANDPMLPTSSRATSIRPAAAGPAAASNSSAAKVSRMVANT